MATALESIDWASMLTGFLYWAGIIITATLMMVVVIVIYYWLSFPYKLTYWTVVGSGQKGLTIDSPKRTRIKWGKNKSYWTSLHPFFNKKRIEPFPIKYIYPNKNLYAFKVGDDFIPANIDLGTQGTEFKIEPIPYHVKNWQIMELKQNEVEFSQKSFWDENKMLIGAVMVVAICCGLAGVTIYYSYSFATTGLENSATRIAELTMTIREALGTKGV